MVQDEPGSLELWSSDNELNVKLELQSSNLLHKQSLLTQRHPLSVRPECSEMHYESTNVTAKICSNSYCKIIYNENLKYALTHFQTVSCT